MRRILVVEDDRTTRLLLRELLKRAGYAVSTASDGRLALRQLRKKQFDLMLVDVWLPRMNGIELLARIRAVLRRAVAPDPAEKATPCLEVGGLRVDPKRHRVLKNDCELKLTLKEFKLLELLLRNPGEVISRDAFLDQVWGKGVYVTHRTVDTHISALRKKIEDNPEDPSYILSVRGIGYKFNEDLTGP